ncbi:hypothetical protein [Candidatus Collinsella stercoripullorum]|nr:hypothetical protein [Candidatus Collinsella stercoripullorum]
MPVINDSNETVHSYLTPDELAELGLGYLVPLGAASNEYIDVDELFDL